MARRQHFSQSMRRAAAQAGKAPDAEARPSSNAADAARLNKAVADAGVCSRRKADQLIFAGRVLVNGVPESNPARRVLPDDRIDVDGTALRRPRTLVHLLLHKPVRVVSTAHDPEGRPTVLDILPEKWRAVRLFPVGRLDFFSEGLLLLTNDGQLAQRLAHPRHHLPKTYHVLVRGKVQDAALEAMRRGMILSEGDATLPAEAEAARLPSGDTRLHLVLRQGLNRQIRRMCRDLGLTILRLRRVAQGPLRLGALPCGAVRPLAAEELARLRASVGLDTAPHPAGKRVAARPVKSAPRH